MQNHDKISAAPNRPGNQTGNLGQMKERPHCHEEARVAFMGAGCIRVRGTRGRIASGSICSQLFDVTHLWRKMMSCVCFFPHEFFFVFLGENSTCVYEIKVQQTLITKSENIALW